ALDGNSSYTGTTTVNTGRLVVNGSQPNSPIVVNDTATLEGLGTTGSVQANAGSTLSPDGAFPGTLHTQALTFASGSTFRVDLNGTTAGTEYDVLSATGSVDLGGSTLSAMIGGGFVPSVGDTFTIITSTGTISGMFVQGTAVTIGGQAFRITYNPNSVVLT